MEYNNIYEVDLAILDAVQQGGSGGGVTPSQVEGMIDSALTPYSTTQQTEAMVQASAGTTTGQVQTQIDTTLTAYSTTSEVEAMIAASGGSGGKTIVQVPWDNTAYTSTTIASLYADAEALYQSGLSVGAVFEKYDIALSDGIRQAMPCIFLKYADGENRVQLGFINDEYGMMIMYGSIYADGHADVGGLIDITGSINSKLSGMGVGLVRALTQQEYDDEGYYEPTTLYIIKPSNN